MGIDEMGVDEMGVDEVGRHRTITHTCDSLFGENFSLWSLIRCMAMFGTRSIGLLMWTSRCSILPFFCNHLSHGMRKPVFQ